MSLSSTLLGRSRTFDIARRYWWRELILVGLIYAVYDGSRLLISGGLPEARRNAHSLLSFEKHLHLAPEHWLNRQFSLHAWLAVPADYTYATLHYLITPLILVWLWRKHHERYRHARTWLGISTVLGLVGFTLLPTAPPRLLEASYGFTDSMAQHASLGWWGADASAPRGLGHMTNEFAAMPSLHVGWALWSGLMLWFFARHLVIRLAGLLYPVLIAVVVMGTGNHYLVDAVAGCLVMLLGAVLASPLLRLTTRVLTPVGARRRSRARTTVVATRIPSGHPRTPQTAETPQAAEPAEAAVRLPLKSEAPVRLPRTPEAPVRTPPLFVPGPRTGD